MIQLQLTTGQKLQVAFIALVVVLAGFFLFRASRPVLNGSVNAWTIVRRVPVDAAKPPGPTNRWDPKKEITVHTFACYDGQMEICEYRNDPSRHMTVAWTKPDLRRKDFIYYRDPFAGVAARKDPYQHAVALAAYSAANGRMLGLLGTCALTPEQLTAEKNARDVMMNTLNVIRMNVDTGNFHAELMEKLATALNNYRRTQGDPMKDTAKAQSAREVLAAASAYLNRIDQEKAAAIEKYIDKLDDLLSSEQKNKIADAGRVFDDHGRRIAGGPAAPRRIATAPPPATPGPVPASAPRPRPANRPARPASAN